MNILGISAFYHDSAAALVCGGKIAAAAQEERFTRVKHDPGYPEKAVEFCLSSSGLRLEDVGFLAFYEKPFRKFDRLLETYLAYAPRGFVSFSKAIPLWLKRKLDVRKELKRRCGPSFKGRTLFPSHHESHAASAFFPSPFERAAILTVDGVGEWATAAISVGEGNKIRMLKEMRFPHSLGLLYSAFTYFAGFKVNSGEYKLMGLAPYGKPVYTPLIKERIAKVMDDGSLWMDMSYFNYCQGLTMTSKKFDGLFGGPPRGPESRITQREMDLAASVQAIAEEAMLKMAAHAKAISGAERLCLAGGVALNCVGNGKILRSGLFKDIWAQPASGDAGGALGAALFCWHQLFDGERRPDGVNDSQEGSLLGPKHSLQEIKAFLDSAGAVYRVHGQEDSLLEEVASLIASGKVVGWFHGRMEFGPRALGARSILGDARSSSMQAAMNLKIKYRESFRPFAPSVLLEDAKDYFELPCESPYMLLVAPVREGLRLAPSGEQAKTMSENSDLLKRVNVPRSSIPAVTHVDYSARVQTVDLARHGRYYRLVRKFKELTGSSVVINTSFNIRGEPIVNSPADAFNCFMNTEMDALVLEDCVLLKQEQRGASAEQAQSYKDSFKLD